MTPIANGIGMFKKWFVMLFTITVLFASGCSHQSPLVGTWEGSIGLPASTDNPQATSEKLPVSITFRDDGTFTTEEGTQTGASGTYKAEDGTLTETFTSYITNGQPRAIPPSSPITQSGTYNVKGDTLTLSIGDATAPATLKRRKP